MVRGASPCPSPRRRHAAPSPCFRHAVVPSPCHRPRCSARLAPRALRRARVLARLIVSPARRPPRRCACTRRHRLGAQTLVCARWRPRRHVHAQPAREDHRQDWHARRAQTRAAPHSTQHTAHGARRTAHSAQRSAHVHVHVACIRYGAQQTHRTHHRAVAAPLTPRLHWGRRLRRRPSRG